MKRARCLVAVALAPLALACAAAATPAPIPPVTTAMPPGSDAPGVAVAPSEDGPRSYSGHGADSIAPEPLASTVRAPSPPTSPLAWRP